MKKEEVEAVIAKELAHAETMSKKDWLAYEDKKYFDGVVSGIKLVVGMNKEIEKED